MAINLPTFPEFDLQPRDTVPVRFKKYVKRLDNMFTAMNITRASQKKAMLLHYVGEETCDVFEIITVPEPPDKFVRRKGILYFVILNKWGVHFN